MTDIIRQYGFVPGRRQFYAFFVHDKFTISGSRIGEKRIARLMKEMNIYPTLRHKDPYKGQATYNHPYYDVNDYVRRYFRQNPRKVILTDITYLSYGANKKVAYLCAFKDAFTNEILGWHLSRRMDVTLIEKAYCMMMDRHEKEIRTACRHMKDNNRQPYVYIHSDQGSQYLSTEFSEILEDDGFISSVSRRGNSIDNAPMESFFGRMKSILNDLLERCPTFDVVRGMVGNYLDEYNKGIPQYELGCQTPEEYYRYVTEGIYQAPVYFGIPAEDMIRQEELESKREQARAERARRRSRQSSESGEGYEYKSRSHPRQIVLRDQKIISRRIDKLNGIVKEYSSEIDRLTELYDDTRTALEFLDSASESVIKSLYYPLNWQKYPQLSYVNRTGAIY